MKHHTFDNISEKTLGYLLHANLCIEVFGNEDQNTKKEKKVATPIKNKKPNQKTNLKKKQHHRLPVTEQDKLKEEQILKEQKELLRRVQKEEAKDKMNLIGNISPNKSGKGRSRNPKNDKDCNLI